MGRKFAESIFKGSGDKMHYSNIKSLVADRAVMQAGGPIAVILLEDTVEVDSTIRHHLDCGFKTLIVCGAKDIAVAESLSPRIHRVDHDMTEDNALRSALNPIIAHAGNQWVYYCYNSEYLFFPFCEHRSVGEMIAFSMEERRHHILTYVVDLYASNLSAHPNGVALENAHLDTSGYYAQARRDKTNEILDRQLDFYGGLRWRFEEHVPYEKRRIGRIGLFRAKPGLLLNEDHSLNDPEYNTYACPWHHSLTASICSFRTAKALKRNPGSAAMIQSFAWKNSAAFEWHSSQLLDLGFMEPGQWF